MLLKHSKPDTALFIGRFQPLHTSHLSVIRLGLKSAEHLIIAIGSANGPRSIYNPFTFTERRHMIEASLTESEMKRVSFARIGDYFYDDAAWIACVQRETNRIAHAIAGEHASISLIGNNKSASSYFLKLFPQWGNINAPNVGGLSATPMRDNFFTLKTDWLDVTGKDYLDSAVVMFLKNFSQTSAYEEMVKEFDFIRNYSRTWGKGPFVTTDAVVVQSANVLMIRRKGRPGKGQLALPGGFLDIKKDETLQQGMLRELDEETNIDVRPEILRSNIICTEAFDAPFRDPRARIITHAFLISLPKQISLPRVRAGDDAAHASWVSLADLKEEEVFGDHFHIINRLKARLPKEI